MMITICEKSAPRRKAYVELKGLMAALETLGYLTSEFPAKCLPRKASASKPAIAFAFVLIS
jgi:hypothetical protein